MFPAIKEKSRRGEMETAGIYAYRHSSGGNRC